MLHSSVGNVSQQSSRSVRKAADKTARLHIHFLDYYTRLFQSPRPGRVVSPRASDFHLVKQIGQGGYGKVYAATKNQDPSSRVYALKKMNKAQLIQQEAVDHLWCERDIMIRSKNSEWLTRLYYAFEDGDSVYLAMEFIPGGDFRTLLNKSGVLMEPHARFYVAQMMLAMNQLHQLGFIHRDLKPENFLIDKTGLLKLTDFGLSYGIPRSRCLQDVCVSRARLRSNIEQLHCPREHLAPGQNLYERFERQKLRSCSVVGSPEYIAIEILLKEESGYDFAVDWWSLGCILYECLAGFTPFAAETTEQVWANVYRWDQVLERPVYSGKDEEFNLSDEAWDMITKLITPRHSRLSSITEAQSHPFLQNFSFSRFRTKKQWRPPFIPDLQSPTDTKYFDDFDNLQDMEVLYKDVHEKEAQLATIDIDTSTIDFRAEFMGFTYSIDTDSN